MKAVEVHEMTDEELVRSLDDTRRELFNLRMRNQTGQTENTASIRKARRDVARLLTEQRERQDRVEV